MLKIVDVYSSLANASNNYLCEVLFLPTSGFSTEDLGT